METLRDSFNLADPNRINAAQRSLPLGELYTLLIASLTPTEAGIAIDGTTHKATLANQPTSLFQVKGIAGTAGIKSLRVGAHSGPAAVAPLPGEVVWDGALKLLFNAADANTTADVTYVTAAIKASILARSIGENDAP